MEKIKNEAKDAVMSDDVIGRIANEVARSDQVIKPIEVFTRNQVYQHVQVRVAEEGFLLSQERLPTVDVKHV